MRRGAPALAALGLLAGLACGGTGEPPPPPAPAGSSARVPPLAVEPPAFDFGRVLPGRSLQKQFRLRNVGRETVAIESVATDCGCMVVGEYARALPPGATTTITVVLQTPPEPGSLLRSLVVRTGGAHAGSLELRVRATVVAEGTGGA